MQPECSSDFKLSPASPSSAPGSVAPVWHTIILLAGIALLSFAGAQRLSAQHAVVDRLHTYGLTAGTELCMLAWIYFGLRLRKVPFRTLLGSVPGDLRSWSTDIGLAILFWTGALFALATLGVFWTMIEAAIQHRAFPLPGNLTPDASQQHTLHTLSQLAPTSAGEVAAWIFLCTIAGIAEELVFRGYLYRQFTAWARGSVAVAAIVSSLFFGAAHGYQGARNMILLAVFGALFCLLAQLHFSTRITWCDLHRAMIDARKKIVATFSTCVSFFP